MTQEENMEADRYTTAHTIANIFVVLGWIVLVVGSLAGIVIIFSEDLGGFLVGFGVLASSLIGGLAAIYNAQLGLILIDSEKNTRKIAEESIKTNMMLAETLGVIAAKVTKLSERN
jgi:hypothetical protein